MKNFFVNEKDASILEKILASQDAERGKTYLLVSVKNGRHAVKDLYINGRSSREILEKARQKAE